MLTALEHGVKGGRWFSLIDKVCALPTLRAAFARVKAHRGSAGVDHVTIEMFAARLEEHLARLARRLGDGTYRPQPIPHAALLDRVRARVSDGRVLALVEAFLHQGVLDGLSVWEPVAGTPQGAVISPLLSNLYLDALDHQMAAHGLAMTRDADDFVIQCRTESAAHRALALVSSWVAEAELTLHSEKTRIVNAREPGGFDFLGYHFERGHRWPSERSLAKITDTLRASTRRVNGQSLDRIISDLNRRLLGWFGHFEHSSKPTFRTLDRLVRRRLRRILRNRLGHKQRRRRSPSGRGHDHERWPNAFLAEHGLFSLVAAHATACRSSRR